MDGELCIITYPVEGYEEHLLKCAIRLGVDKVILMDENESYLNLFNRFGLITDVMPILSGDTKLVVNSVLDMISDAKNEYEEVIVFLPPSDTITTAGIYVASCMERVEVVAPRLQSKVEYLTLPLFPFSNLNENERFVLTKIIENDKISRKNLFAIISKEGYCDKLCPRCYGDLATKERSAFRQLQRILNRLERIGLISKERMCRHFIWNSTVFGKLASFNTCKRKGKFCEICK